MTNQALPSETPHQELPDENPEKPEGKTGIDNLFDLFEAKGFERKTDRELLEMLSHATFDEALDAVNAVHNVLAPEVQPGYFDKTMSLLAPGGEVRATTASPEDRIAILQHGFDLIKATVNRYLEQENSAENPDAAMKNALERAGNLAAFAIVLAHPYENGNGRTARVIGHAIRYGYDREDEEGINDLTKLGGERPEKGFRINSYVPGQNVQANEDPIGFLNQIAAPETPFDSEEYYRDVQQEMGFMTPYG